MAAIRELCLTVLFLLVSQISGLQTNSANQTACESSNVAIAFNYNLDGDSFSERTWYINSNTAANRIANVTSARNFTVEPQYSGRVTLSGPDEITLHTVNKSDSGRYLFVIVTAVNYDLGTAITTVNVYVNPNDSCIPIIEKNSTGNYTCKISDACNGKDNIQAIWDNGSDSMFTCPSVKMNTKYKCCAKGDPVTYCYNGSMCAEIQCNGSAATTPTVEETSKTSAYTSAPRTFRTSTNESGRDSHQLVIIISVSVCVIVLELQSSSSGAGFATTAGGKKTKQNIRHIMPKLDIDPNPPMYKTNYMM